VRKVERAVKKFHTHTHTHTSARTHAIELTDNIRMYVCIYINASG